METVQHEKYGRVRVIKRVPSDRGGLALIRTKEYGLSWVRASAVGQPCFVYP
jgi:hypothetical protein